MSSMTVRRPLRAASVAGMSSTVLIDRVPTPNSPGDTAARQAALRRRAEVLLSDVMGGAEPLPLTAELARAMAQVAFASRSTRDPSTSGSLQVFLALLAHPDLPEEILEWVLHDLTLRHPAAFAALVSHPGLTDRVLVSAVRLVLWHTHGAVDPDDWSFSHPLIPILRASGYRGRAAALLLSLWADESFDQFELVLRRLFEASEPALEVLSTLAADLRQSRRSRSFRLGRADLSRLVDQAVLLVAPAA